MNLKNPTLPLNHHLLKNKQSEEFIRFENSLSLRYNKYGELLNRYETAIKDIDKLESKIIK